MRLFCLLLLVGCFSQAFGQKMLLLERANRAKTTKIYIGETLHYRIAGDENYWYQRAITDMLPESNTLLLDNFVVKLSDIDELKMHRKPIIRITGGAVFAFGATLSLATTVAALYRDKDTNYGALYATAAGSLGVGFLLNTKRTLKMGNKHRLRLIEIKFQQPGN
ncbi:MAG: hypothetical protein IPJ82_11115 [Lewinellaceae bacterium]|nr:hypothetical protein [Lewinellaceae bacterium]